MRSKISSTSPHQFFHLRLAITLLISVVNIPSSSTFQPHATQKSFKHSNLGGGGRRLTSLAIASRSSPTSSAAPSSSTCSSSPTAKESHNNNNIYSAAVRSGNLLSILGAGGTILTSTTPQRTNAAELSILPQEVKSALIQMKESEYKEDPVALRDAVKSLSEYPGLDELTFDLQARETVNTELKDLQRARPDLWESETTYYRGVVRRAVNPFHVIELSGWLKVAPVLGGLGYLAAIFVQRKAPQFFALAYFGALAVLVGPAVYLVIR